MLVSLAQRSKRLVPIELIQLTKTKPFRPCLWCPMSALYFTFAERPQGGVISTSKRVTDVDREILRASHIPGPQDYPAPELPKTSGGVFSNANSKTELEWVIYRAKQTPGPGSHDIRDPRLFGSWKNKQQ